MKKKSEISMMKWARDLFPFNRSLTGKGNVKTLNYIKSINKNFKILYTNSGKKVFDWKIPNEWEVKKAYFEDTNKKKYCDFTKHNLHLVGYSQPFSKTLSFNKLKKKIYTDKKNPDAIPYVTSYYKKDWGFCMKYKNFKKLKKKEKFKVLIDSKIFKGKMHYSEMLIKGKSKKEILIVSYICHPSMANNELSGPLIVMALSKLLKKSKYSVRLLLVPETIGAIDYIKKKERHLKKNLIAGFNLTCIGDSGPFTLISSKEENTYADKVAYRILSKTKKFKKLSFLKRGSNERQFGCQNMNLPFVTICRSRFLDFKEYHTSNDNLKMINEKNLNLSLKYIFNIISEIQKNKIYVKRQNCEPFFSKYNLIRKTRGGKKPNLTEIKISDIVAYAGANYDEKELVKKINITKENLTYLLNKLKKFKILKELL